MNWGGLDNFLHMGGYGFYVWSSYGACLAVAVAEVMLLRQSRRQALQRAREAAARSRQPAGTGEMR